jgi:DNA-directed RNA polymerase specialized sigma24 family protein
MLAKLPLLHIMGHTVKKRGWAGARLEMKFDPDRIERYRRKLGYKVCYHLGSFCPDIEDVVQETLTRFLRAIRDDQIRNPESVGAFLSGICNNVIQEYRRRLWKEPGPTEVQVSVHCIA